MVPNQSCVGEGVGIMLWLGLGGSMLSIRKVVSSIRSVTRYPFPIQIVECPGSPPASFRVWQHWTNAGIEPAVSEEEEVSWRQSEHPVSEPIPVVNGVMPPVGTRTN